MTARDAAGNTTAITYTQTSALPFPSAHDAIMLQSIAYNGATTTLSNASAVYHAAFNRRKDTLEAFSADLRTASSTVIATYEPRRNETIITTSPTPRPKSKGDKPVHFNRSNDMRPERQTLPGLVILYITTEKGSLIINY